MQSLSANRTAFRCVSKANARQEVYSINDLGDVRGRKLSRNSMLEAAGLRAGYAAGCCARLTSVLRGVVSWSRLVENAPPKT